MNITRQSAPEEVPFILTAKEAATWTGTHHDTLRGLAANGTIPSVRIGGKLGFRRDELLACMSRAGRTTNVRSR